MRYIWSVEAWADYGEHRSAGDKASLKKIDRLLEDARRDLAGFINASEPLKHGLSGFYSRRITKEHRLVFRPTDSGDIEIAQCRFHYDDH